VTGTETADPAAIVKTIAWLDRATLGLAIAIIYLGLFVSRAKAG
jgi:hypothetical protein